jgi:transcriptional regulator with XRE-family HTH domain
MTTIGGTVEHSVRNAADLGAAIRAARLASAATQLELAEDVGVTRSYLAMIERGRSSRLLDLLLDLLRVLDLELVVRRRAQDDDGA